MPRRTNPEDDFDSDDDGFDSDDDDSEFDSDEDDEEPTIPCPYCRRQIHEDAQRCPYCENYISAEDTPEYGDHGTPGAKPLWFVVGLLACLLIAVLWIVGGR